MNYIDKLEINSYYRDIIPEDILVAFDIINDDSLTIRTFKPISIGEYDIHVFASSHSYCHPQRTLNNLYLYRTMEISVSHRGTLDFVDVIDEFPDFKFNNELSEHMFGLSYSYVPVEIIQKLYEHLIYIGFSDLHNKWVV